MRNDVPGMLSGTARWDRVPFVVVVRPFAYSGTGVCAMSASVCNSAQFRHIAADINQIRFLRTGNYRIMEQILSCGFADDIEKPEGMKWDSQGCAKLKHVTSVLHTTGFVC